jgi:hypothetical protein
MNYGVCSRRGGSMAAAAVEMAGWGVAWHRHRHQQGAREVGNGRGTSSVVLSCYI